MLYSEPGNRHSSISLSGLGYSQSENDLFNDNDISACEHTLSSKFQTNDIDDIDIKLAAQVLGDLKNSVYALLLESHFPPRQITSQNIPDGTQNENSLGILLNTSALATSPSSQHFLDRFVGIPVINQSINTISSAYEATKATSSVLKYSVETVETGVRNISSMSSLVVDRLNPLLAPVDKFACTQLDMLERSFPSIISSASNLPRDEISNEFVSQPSTSEIQQKRSHLLSTPSVPLPDTSLKLQSRLKTVSPSIDITSSSRSNYFSSPVSSRTKGHLSEKSTVSLIERKPRFTWHQVVDVGANLSSLVLSNDTKRALNYCLQWLRYAINHIDRQLVVLKEYIECSYKTNFVFTDNIKREESSSISHAPKFVSIVRREIVETVRKVVNVISRYAARYLPGDQRRSVRGFILSLPQRWAVVLSQSPITSECPTPLGSPSSLSSSPRVQEEALKIVALAEESKGMLGQVHDIFARSVESVEKFTGKSKDCDMEVEEYRNN
ncbi:hypothetical protein HK096_010853 [Nowakowskiella sp. JEL0078]|nr:hypothetical protein HK096_010853 [Nowakowskiella sp. JEL0078]